MNKPIFDVVTTDGSRVRPETARVIVHQTGINIFSGIRIVGLRVKTFEVYEIGGLFRWSSNDAIPPASAEMSYGLTNLPGYNAAAQAAERTSEIQVLLAALVSIPRHPSLQTDWERNQS